MPAVKKHSTDTTQADWDAPTQVANLGDDYTKKTLKKVFAWITAEDQIVKTDCLFPHHLVSVEGKPGAADVNACQSAIGILNGAMGGADIPGDDRQGVYDHLAAHLKDAGVDAPELNAHPSPAAAGPGLSGPDETKRDVGTSADEIRATEGLPALPTADAAAAEREAHHTPATTTPRPSGPEETKRGAPMPAADLSERERIRGVERRSTPFKGIELRDKADGTGGSTLHFEGYACITEAGYEMEDWAGPFTEVVRSGAFTTTLAQAADVPFKINHEGLTLARTKSGTMRLAEDTTGLHVDADLDPASPHVQGLRSAMDRGDVDEMSFAFWVTRQQWSPDWMQRDIVEVNLNKGDVSVVNYGANPNTAGASLRGKALIDHMRLLSERERRDLFDRLFAEFQPQADPPDALLLADRSAMLQWVHARSAELREGKALSTATMDVLSRVLDLVAAADVAVDEAQPMLADLMGVTNPDEEADDDGDPDGDTPDQNPDDGGDFGQDGATTPQANSAPLAVYERRVRALTLSAA